MPKSDGGQELATWCPMFQTRKMGFLCHFLTQWSSDWWIGSILDHPLNLLLSSSLWSTMSFWLQTSKFWTSAVSMQSENSSSLTGRWRPTWTILLPLPLWMKMDGSNCPYTLNFPVKRFSKKKTPLLSSKFPACITRGYYNRTSRHCCKNISFYTF